MDMSPNTPSSVPIIGQPTLTGAITTVSLRCTCLEHIPLMGVAGGGPIECPVCHARWVVGAEVKLQIGQVGPAPVLDVQ